MIRAVLDANVIVSAVLGLDREESVPGALWRYWRLGAFTLVTSIPLIAEISRTFGNVYFSARIPPELVAQTVESLTEDALHAVITETVRGVATHPEDDLILATALSAKADVLVTGDKQLQALGIYQGIRIMSPRRFLDELDGEG